MQTFGEYDINAPRTHINSRADIFRKRDQQFAGRSEHLKQRRARDAFAGKKNVANRSDHAGSDFRIAGRRGEL